MHLHDLMDDLDAWTLVCARRDEGQLMELLRKHQFMLLPYDPNPADIAIMQRGGLYTRNSAESMYAALADRRRIEVNVGSDTPAKAPFIRQD